MSFYTALNAAFATGMRVKPVDGEVPRDEATAGDAARVIVVLLVAQIVLTVVPYWSLFLDGSFLPSLAADPIVLVDIYVISLLTISVILLIFLVAGVISRSAHVPMLMVFVGGMLLLGSVITTAMGLFGTRSDTPMLLAIFFGARGARRILPNSVGAAFALGFVAIVAAEAIGFLLFVLPEGGDLLQAAARH